MAALNDVGVVLGQEVHSRNGYRLVDIRKGGLAMFWVVFGFMSVAAIIVWAVTLMKPRGHRANGLCSAVLLTTAAFAYYAMASKGGYTYVRVFQETRTARQVYYARYVDWFITTPLLLLDLLLLAGVANADVIWIMIADVGMVLAGLFGAILPNKFKWGWFAIGCIFMMFVFWGLLFHARKACMLRSKKLGAAYSGLAIYLIFLCLLGLAEGTNIISPSAEAFSYGVLDILAKVVFSLVILFMVEPIVKGVRGKEHWVPSLLAAPVNGPLTGGDWQPGTAHENPSDRQVAPAGGGGNGNNMSGGEHPPAMQQPVMHNQSAAQRPVVPANSAHAPHLRTDPVV